MNSASTDPVPEPAPYQSSRKILHVDMDAFYASVEVRDDPSLRGQPVVVGGDPQHRGVVAAASYEARDWGIHSAMPMKTAMQKCPRAIRISPDFSKYRRVSEQIHLIFSEYTDLVEPIALDEAYLDVTDNKHGIPFGYRVAKLIKADIRRETGLTASAGLGPNKSIAKIASDLKKPDGLVGVRPDEVDTFLAPLPVRKIPGVGSVTHQALGEMDIETIGQLATTPADLLRERFGKRGAYLYRLAHGEDDDPVSAERDQKQLSSETTFVADIFEVARMRETIEELVREVTERLQRKGLKGRVLTLKVRYPDFETVTRSRTDARYQERVEPVLRQALQLLARTDAEQRGVRLLGVGVSGFDNDQRSRQLDLFEEEDAQPA